MFWSRLSGFYCCFYKVCFLNVQRKKLKEEIITQKRLLENNQFSVNINNQWIFFDVAEIDFIYEGVSRRPYSQMRKFTKIGKN